MKKKLLYFFLALIILIALVGLSISTLVSSYLDTTLNSNPDRKNEIFFESLSISLIRSRIELKNLEIKPLNTEEEATLISGSVKKAEISGYSIWDFLVSKELTIGELSFLNPSFKIIQNDTLVSHSKSAKPFQRLFGDIVSRGKIKNFSIVDGQGDYFIQGDSLRRVGGFKEFNLDADGLETDSVMVGHAIPFQVENIYTSFTNLNYQLNDDQNLYVGSFEFDFKSGQLEFKDLGLSFDKSWQEIARTKAFQTDIIDFHIGSLSISKLNTSSRLYDSLLIMAGSIVVDSLVFRDGRDKNIPRPRDEIKKNFTTMLEALQFPIEVDSLFLKNSKITYSEIEEGKTKPGILALEDVNGLITNLTSIDSSESKLPLTIDIKAKLNGKGKLNFKLIENYHSKTFQANVSLGAMNMVGLNPTLSNLAGIEIESGQLIQLYLEILAGPTKSDNHFVMDYSDLKMVLLDKEKGKNGVLSTVANLAINKDNLPKNKNYKTPSYSTQRNIFRGPINLIWLSIKDGLMSIIPTGFAQKLIPPSKEGEKRKSRTGK